MKTRAARPGRPCCSDVETDMHDIPVPDNIVLALQAQFGFGLGLRHAAQFE